MLPQTLIEENIDYHPGSFHIEIYLDRLKMGKQMKEVKANGGSDWSSSVEFMFNNPFSCPDHD